MFGPTFHERNLVGPALVPQTVNAGGNSDGVTISNPGKSGRKLSFILMAATLTSVTVLKVKVQGRETTAGAWEDVQTRNLGTNVDLQFPATRTIDNAALENGALLGTLPIFRLPYQDYRLVVETVTGGNVTLAASYIINDLYDHPSGQTDELYAQCLPDPNPYE